MTTTMINGTTPPTTPPTMAPVLLFTFRLPEITFVTVGRDEAELDGGMDEVEGTVLDMVLLCVLSVFTGLGVASGRRPTDIAIASLYVSFGRLVTL